MSPVAGTLLTLADVRRLRDAMTERELLARCRDAARLEMRGANYSPDDRADVAAQIMIDGLGRTAGTLPRRDDQQHSLTAYCGRAKNARRAIDRERERDKLAADLADDLAAQSVDALSPEYLHDAPETVEPSPDAAAKLATVAAAKLADGSTDVRTLAYRMVRDRPSEQIAAELGRTANAIDLACARARKILRGRYPNAAELLAVLVGQPRTVIVAGEPVLIYCRDDRSREATGHGKTWTGKAMRNAAAEWRTGTDGGSYPTRPANADAAREVCTLRRTRTRKARTTDAQATADALRNLGRALAHT